MSMAGATAQRMVALAERGADAPVLHALSERQRRGLEWLLREVDEALERGETRIEEATPSEPSDDRPAGFAAAEALASAAEEASARDAAAGMIRLVERVDDDRAPRSVYVLRGPPGARTLATARCADDERRLAAALLERVSSGQARSGAMNGGDRAPGDPEERQRRAVEWSRSRRLLIVTGGPGTGKTRTIARIVASAPAPAEGTPRIQVMAPTGRAAARLREQLDAERAMATAPGAAGVAAAPAAGAVSVSTIHTALRWRPVPGAPFLHSALRPLPADLVVVDECSMVDLALMRRLVEATPASATLVLVGDADQLASIQSGSVFADCCASRSLHGCVVRLEHNFRTQGNPDASWLESLVRAVQEGDAERAIRTLRDRDALIEPASGPMGRTRRTVALAEPEYRAMIESIREDPVAAHAALRRFRVLAATRRGDGGIEWIAQRLEQELLGAHRRIGRQVIVTANDHELGLANGDMGVVLEQGVMIGRHPDGAPRIIPAASLPEHEPAWAISIHRSQGSEYERVVVVLPDPPSRILSRQLLYTALTRSQGQVRVIASEASIREAVERPVRRASGLLERLDSCGARRIGDGTRE